MKRNEFIEEMKQGFFQTAKSVVEPFLQDDLEKIANASDIALGIKWLPICSIEEIAKHPELKFIEGNPIILSVQGTNILAGRAICPECSNLIILTELYSVGKCLNCEIEFNFLSGTGNLLLQPIPVKYTNGKAYLGIRK